MFFFSNTQGGDHKERGIIPRALNCLFEAIEGVLPGRMDKNGWSSTGILIWPFNRVYPQF
jgi:hypothetical protein